MVYAYIRVSTKDQVVERQIDGILKHYPDIPRKNIYIEHESGKKNNRTIYTKLRNKLKPHDELIIHELDRISRDKEFINEELAFLKKKKIILRILELPTTMHQFTEETKWVGEMVNNILIEVYSTMAQHERERLSQRTKQGLEAAKLRGRIGGRPEKDKAAIKLSLKLYKQDFTITEICLMTQLSRACFYKHLRFSILELLEKGKSDEFIMDETGCSETYLRTVKRKGIGTYG